MNFNSAMVALVVLSMLAGVGLIDLLIKLGLLPAMANAL